MLDFLRDKASDRKLRLFACACCRRVEKFLWSGKVGHEAILTAERHADGSATYEELETARQRVWRQLELYPQEPVYDASYWACVVDAQQAAAMSARCAAGNSTLAVHRDAVDFDALCEKRRNEELAIQGQFLHDLFGPLLFRSVHLNPYCLAWNNGTVCRIAQTVYDNRAFDQLPVLADALEEAGCTSADLLAHLRGPGPHIRGCWAIDLPLGKR
jgi:hypothetical protein